MLHIIFLKNATSNVKPVSTFFRYLQLSGKRIGTYIFCEKKCIFCKTSIIVTHIKKQIHLETAKFSNVFIHFLKDTTTFLVNVQEKYTHIVKAY
jgi:hypothetical protein